MGNTQTKPLDGSGRLPADMQAAAAALVASKKTTTAFGAYLIRFLAPSVDRLALILDGQAEAVFELAGLHTEPNSVREFVMVVSEQALCQFWGTGANIDSAFIDWVVGQAEADTALEFDSESAETKKTQQRAKWITDASAFGGVSLEQWRPWWTRNRIMHELLSLALTSVLATNDHQALLRGVREEALQAPRLSVGFDGLLQAPLAWALMRELPQTSQKSWERVYSTFHNGKSWSSFQVAIELCGALLLVVKEKRGGVFGAYLDADLEKKPSWYGSSLNFVFTSASATEANSGNIRVFRTTGFNDHYQYFNYGTKTLPNGLGTGGQMEHFALWIGKDFVTGHSNTSATYDSPQLSVKQEFEIEHVEAWIVRRSEREDVHGGPKRSALDTNPDAVALLEMANRTMYSKMVREPEPRDDDSDT